MSSIDSENRVELVIFDCDGTLVDTEKLTNRLISNMLAERHVLISPEECIKRFAGKTLLAIIDYTETFIGPIDHKMFEYEYRERCVPLFESELVSIEGAESILQNLRAKKCIASNGPLEKMKITLKTTGLGRFFESSSIFSAYEIGKWKPDPGLFLHAARQFGINKENALVIEDSLSGVEAAINAQMEVLVYNPSNDDELLLPGIKNFNSMSQLSHYLKDIGILSYSN